MENLKRYNYKLTNPTTYAIEMVESKSGDYVKFSDIKDILNSTPNTTKVQICPECDGTGNGSPITNMWQACVACRGMGKL